MLSFARGASLHIWTTEKEVEIGLFYGQQQWPEGLQRVQEKVGAQHRYLRSGVY